jgi:hypothetical protein
MLSCKTRPYKKINSPTRSISRLITWKIVKPAPTKKSIRQQHHGIRASVLAANKRSQRSFKAQQKSNPQTTG